MIGTELNIGKIIEQTARDFNRAVIFSVGMTLAFIGVIVLIAFMGGSQ